MKVALLNTSILTTFGEYSYRPITLENARTLVKTQGYESFIGHEATAHVLSIILGVKVEVNRGEYMQQGGMVALVFKLNARMTELRELSIDEINQIGYTLGVLTKVNLEREPINWEFIESQLD
jgi:hypothetical protein